MPGRSTISTMSPPSSTLRAWRSTVTPGQLPARDEAPVTRLKNVDLPVFGMPTSAMRFMESRSADDLDLAGLAASEDDVGGAETHVQRSRENALAHHPDPLADAKAHCGQAQAHLKVRMDCGNDAGGACSQMRKRRHRRISRE